MSFGVGVGSPWGGTEPLDDSAPLAEIAGDPVSYVFGDEPDGPLPGNWEPYVWDHDVAGDVSAPAEPSQDTYFRIVSGMGLWDYALTLGGGADFTERGYAIAPAGVVEGHNLRAFVIFAQPEALLDPLSDEFVYEVGVGVRFVPDDVSYVGGRVRAAWASGVWVTKLALEAIEADGTDPSVLATADLSTALDQDQDPLDHWRSNPRPEMIVEIRNGELIVTLNGVISVSVAVPYTLANSRPVIFAKVYNRTGSTITPVPAISALQLQSLRDLERLGPPPQLEGDMVMEAPLFPMMRLPIGKLLELGNIKQVGSRQYVVLHEFVAEVQSLRMRFRVGETIRLREKYVGQELASATNDLAAQRGRSGL